MEFNGTFQRHSSRKWRMFSDIHDIAVKLRSDASPPYEQVQSVTAAWVRRKVERTDYETETLVKTATWNYDVSVYEKLNVSYQDS